MGRSTPLPAPPATPTRLRVTGEPEPGASGELVLVPGVGQKISRVEGVFTLDAEGAEPTVPLNVFVPGTLAAKTLARISNRKKTGRTRLKQLEANLLTAPNLVDAANHIAVRVRGLQGGDVSLPLSVSGQSRFLWDPAASQPRVVAGADNPLPSNTANGRNLGFLQKIQPTASFAGLSAMAMLLHSEANPAGAYQWDKRYVVMDGARADYIAASDWFAFPFPAYSWLTRDFQKSFTLDQGVDYWIGFETRRVGGGSRHTIFDPGSLANGPEMTPAAQNLFACASASPNRKIFLGPTETVSQLAGNDANWPQIINDNASGWSQPFRLFGGASGVDLTGDVELSLVSVGAPGAAPGADANITAQIFDLLR